MMNLLSPARWGKRAAESDGGGSESKKKRVQDFLAASPKDNSHESTVEPSAASQPSAVENAEESVAEPF